MLYGLIPLWLLALDWTLRILLAIHVVLRRRPVSTSLAWLVLLVFVPVIGIFAYFLVGETRLGLRRVARYDRISRELDQHAVAVWKHQCTAEEGELHDWTPIARFGTAVSDFPPVKGNKLALINDSEAFLDRLVKDIDRATHHVHLLTYIWAPSAHVDQVAEALIRAARRGVECRVLVDAVGCKRFNRSPWPGLMTGAGVKVVEALPVNPVRMLLARIDLRNHRKIAVIDGRIAFVGSQNISDATFRSSRVRRTGPWIDATARIEGSAAQALGLVFLRDWILDSDEQIGDITRFIPEIECPTDGSIVQVVPSGPGPGPDAIRQAVITTLYAARQEILITTPYFVPDDALRMALTSAAMRGVKVTIVMPKVSDSPLVAAASRAFYLELLEAGVRILHYRKGLLHAKTVSIDTGIAMIGSANLDQRSFFLNFEVSLFIYDDDSASLLRFMQEDYLRDSDEVSLEEWRGRSMLQTFIDNAVQLMGPLL